MEITGSITKINDVYIVDVNGITSEHLTAKEAGDTLCELIRTTAIEYIISEEQ